MGKKDCVAYLPYVEWVKKRAENYYLHFPVEVPLYPQVSHQHTSVSIERYNNVQAINQEFRVENEELSRKLYRSTSAKNETTYEAESKKRQRHYRYLG